MDGIYIDMGSTNTRVWLMRDLEVLAHARAEVGVADSARDGSTKRVTEGLRKLIGKLPTGGASFAIGAGMIGSSLGLVERTHLIGPAGEHELAAATQPFRCPEITDLPLLVVPGVRFEGKDQGTMTSDMMRGEETLGVGLWNTGQLGPASVLLNLGSHWKAISLDHQGRVASSVTSLSGELLQAARTQTILASSIPAEWPDELDQSSVEAGVKEQRAAGLPRALFCIRLLEQSAALSPAQSFSFLCGAFIGADLDNLLQREILGPDSHVAITGPAAVATAWQRLLTQQSSIRATLISETDRERALLRALHSFAVARTNSSGYCTTRVINRNAPR